MSKLKSLLSSMLSKKRRDYINVLLIFITVSVGIGLEYSIIKIVFIAVIVYFIANPLPSKLLAKMTICALLLLPVSIIFNRSDITQDLSIIIYVLLAGMALMLFVESFFTNKQKD